MARDGVMVYRRAWERTHGPIPSGCVVHHIPRSGFSLTRPAPVGSSRVLLQDQRGGVGLSAPTPPRADEMVGDERRDGDLWPHTQDIGRGRESLRWPCAASGRATAVPGGLVGRLSTRRSIGTGCRYRRSCRDIRCHRRRFRATGTADAPAPRARPRTRVVPWQTGAGMGQALSPVT
jgi:hypothetical protein